MKRRRVYGTSDLDDHEIVEMQVGGGAKFTLEKIPISKLSVYTVQDWIDGEGIEEEGESILDLVEMYRAKKKIPPIVLRPHGDGYDILDGGYRASAAAEAGLREIQAFVLLPYENPDEGLRRLEREAAQGDALAAERLKAARERLVPTLITRQNACSIRGTVYHVRLRNADGSPLRARINGACRTWKRSPERFQIPFKHGMYDFGYIDETNAHLWRLYEEAALAAGPEAPRAKPDQGIRYLERIFAETGAAEDEARLMVALVRVGRVREDHLRFLAEVGDEAAQLATGVVGPVAFLPYPVDHMMLTGLVAFSTLMTQLREAGSYSGQHLRRVLDAINDSLATGNWWRDRDWNALASENVGSDAELAASAFELSSVRRALAVGDLMERVILRHGPPYGDPRLETTRETLEASLLRWVKPYVMAGSPAQWDTGWSW